MSVLSWGKCIIEHTKSKDGTPETNWEKLDIPKENTTKLTPKPGNEVDATEEGGGVVDSRTSKTTYTFEFDLFVKKGGTRSFEDDDGIIAGEHAFRVTPEDEGCEGILIERSTLRVDESYNTADGKILHYVARCLRPKTGKTVKPYVKTSVGA